MEIANFTNLNLSILTSLSVTRFGGYNKQSYHRSCTSKNCKFCFASFWDTFYCEKQSKKKGTIIPKITKYRFWYHCLEMCSLNILSQEMTENEKLNWSYDTSKSASEETQFWEKYLSFWSAIFDSQNCPIKMQHHDLLLTQKWCKALKIHFMK